VAFSAIAVPVGRTNGWLRYTPTSDSLGFLLTFVAIAFVIPSFVEELIFRVLLLPHPSEKRSRRAVIGLVLASSMLFALWHPLGGLLLLPGARPLFYDPAFLGLCGLFGATSSIAYLRTGSIWPSVGMHWAIVVLWRFFFGGWISALGGPG
jgi:predicted Abi (CAAX) family protease